MQIKRRSERLPWVAAALLFSAAAMADEPRAWLERMNEALTTRNYDGVFSHWQDGKVEMLRIIHRSQNGEVRERLVSLDGSGREFVRSGGELSCYLPDRRTVLVESQPKGASLLGGFPAIDDETAGQYDISEVKRTRFNRRDTRVIAVTPHDQFRYGYRLWIDEKTAMPLKTQLCDGHGKIIEQVVFASLTLSSRIPDSAFKPEVATDGFKWLRNDATLPVGASATDGAPGNTPAMWSALQLPPGFRMTARAAQLLPGSHEPVAHLVFTDGLASVSVFVESRSQTAQPNQPPVSGSTSFGTSSAFFTVVDGHKVTAVGEVPPETVRFIANSVKADVRSMSAH